METALTEHQWTAETYLGIAFTCFNDVAVKVPSK